MARVSRIRVVVEIEEDDGSLSVTEVEGVPKPGNVHVQIVPHHRAEYSRSQQRIVTAEVVDVRVAVEAVLLPLPGAHLFRAVEGQPARLGIGDRPQPDVFRIEP